MLQKLKNKTEGFTIIEVLIVLAIAGLIILIVFLAVPALQRNARNTQRKNDAAGMASAAATVVNNTNGNQPKQVTAGDGITASDTSMSMRPSTTITTSETTKLGFYKAGTTTTWGTSTGNVFISDQTAATVAPTITVVAPTTTATATSINKDSATIVVGFECNNSNSALGTKNTRAISILYVNEAAGGNGNLQCVS